MVPAKKPARPDDPELLSLAAAGDPTAQERLVVLLRRRVRTIALAIVGHAADAEDTVQCALMEILASARTFRGENLYAWSDRIAVRTAVRHARKRRVRSAQVDATADPSTHCAAPSSPSPEHAIPRPLLDYLVELPEARRTALVLRHVMDYSLDEIAELTSTPVNTVKDRLLQARRQVRQRIRRDLACRPTIDRSPR